jgi:ribosomal protein S1
VSVIAVDEKRKRISFSMRETPGEPRRKAPESISKGERKKEGKDIKPKPREKKEESSSPFAKALKDLKIPRH